jgi:hypothetical protein
MQTTEVIAEHDRWRELSKSVRDKLVAERDELSARLAEVNRRLAEMAYPESMGGGLEEHPTVRPITLERISPSDSISEAIRKILKASSKPLTAAEVRAHVEKFRTLDRRATVHSILFQFKNKGLLEVHDQEGKSAFVWKGPA